MNMTVKTFGGFSLKDMIDVYPPFPYLDSTIKMYSRYDNAKIYKHIFFHVNSILNLLPINSWPRPFPQLPQLIYDV